MDKWTLQEEAFKRGYEKGKADAVVHGRWVGRIDRYGFCGLPRCSICGKVSFTISKYCQDCGAKMDGDGNG